MQCWPTSALHAPRRHLSERLIALDEAGVTFRYKDYRRPASACLGVCRPKPWPGCVAMSAPARRMRPCGAYRTDAAAFDAWCRQHELQQRKRYYLLAVQLLLIA